MAFTSTSFGALHHADPAQKGGVGSKGGHVIGYTKKTNRAIYVSHHADHPDYKGFTQQDHMDAFRVHGDEAELNQRNLHDLSKMGPKQKQATVGRILSHHKLAEQHLHAAYKKG